MCAILLFIVFSRGNIFQVIPFLYNQKKDKKGSYLPHMRQFGLISFAYGYAQLGLRYGYLHIQARRLEVHPEQFASSVRADV